MKQLPNSGPPQPTNGNSSRRAYGLRLTAKQFSAFEQLVAFREVAEGILNQFEDGEAERLLEAVERAARASDRFRPAEIQRFRQVDRQLEREDRA